MTLSDDEDAAKAWRNRNSDFQNSWHDRGHSDDPTHAPPGFTEVEYDVDSTPFAGLQFPLDRINGPRADSPRPSSPQMRTAKPPTPSFTRTYTTPPSQTPMPDPLGALDWWRAHHASALAMCTTDNERDLVSIAYDLGAMDARRETTAMLIDGMRRMGADGPQDGGGPDRHTLENPE